MYEYVIVEQNHEYPTLQERMNEFGRQGFRFVGTLTRAQPGARVRILMEREVADAD